MAMNGQIFTCLETEPKICKRSLAEGFSITSFITLANKLLKTAVK